MDIFEGIVACIYSDSGTHVLAGGVDICCCVAMTRYSMQPLRLRLNIDTHRT